MRVKAMSCNKILFFRLSLVIVVRLGNLDAQVSTLCQAGCYWMLHVELVVPRRIFNTLLQASRTWHYRDVTKLVRVYGG